MLSAESVEFLFEPDARRAVDTETTALHLKSYQGLYWMTGVVYVFTNCHVIRHRCFSIHTIRLTLKTNYLSLYCSVIRQKAVYTDS